MTAISHTSFPFCLISLPFSSQMKILKKSMCSEGALLIFFLLMKSHQHDAHWHSWRSCCRMSTVLWCLSYSWQRHQVQSVITVLTLPGKELKHREFKWLAWGQKASAWWSQDVTRAAHVTDWVQMVCLRSRKDQLVLVFASVSWPNLGR